MILELNKRVTDVVSGKTIQTEEDKDADLRYVIVNALVGTIKGDENLDGKKKFELWELAGKINDTKVDVELTTEEVAKIKERVGKFYPIAIVGSAYNLIENVSGE